MYKLCRIATARRKTRQAEKRQNIDKVLSLSLFSCFFLPPSYALVRSLDTPHTLISVDMHTNLFSLFLSPLTIAANKMFVRPESDSLSTRFYSVDLSVSLSIGRSACASFIRFLFLSISIFVCLSVCLSICL